MQAEFLTVLSASQSPNVADISSARSFDRRTHRPYRNQSSVTSEITLRICSEPKSGSRTDQILLELLEYSGTLSRADTCLTRDLASQTAQPVTKVVTVLFPNLVPSIKAISNIAKKIASSQLGDDAGIVAANHIFLTGCNLASALAMVSASNKYTVADFLLDCAVDISKASRDLTLIFDSTEIVQCVIGEKLLDENTLRLAVRLRYLVCNGILSAEAAIAIFKLLTISNSRMSLDH